jgi:phosphatidylglycerol---prolipoprotein diacylglyceryl transferase
MRRVLFRWRRITIYSYPCFLYLGMVCGLLAGVYAGSIRHVNPKQLYLAILLLLIPALIGARLLYVMEHAHYFLRNPGRIWMQSKGGASLYGGFLLALLLSLPLLHLLGISFGSFWDAATITMMLGMSVTKIGCLLNGCCAGHETPSRFAQYLPNVKGVWHRRIPSQLLESALALAILAIGCARWSTLPFDGAFFLFGAAAYSIGRWWLEGTREVVERFRGVSINRMISTAVVFSVTVSLVVRFYGSY